MSARPGRLPCPADDELVELLAQLLERAWRRRHPVATVATADQALCPTGTALVSRIPRPRRRGAQ